MPQFKLVTADANPRTLLLLEDQELDALIFMRMLKSCWPEPIQTYHVREAHEAMKFLNANTCDIVVADLNLPDLHGIETIQRLRPYAPDSAFVVLTGLDDSNIKEEAKKLGVSDFVAKDTLDRDLLREVLSGALEQQQIRERVLFLAHYDPLTVLANRRLFQERLNRAVRNDHRNPKQLGIMLVDLDRFAHINNSLGHDAGDFVLQVIARRLKACLRDSDTAARMGSDQFALLTHTVSANAMPAIAERVLNACRKPITLHEHTLTVTASLGGALMEPAISDAAQLLARAKDALSLAKKEGDRMEIHLPPPMPSMDPAPPRPVLVEAAPN
ncbi:MAG: diguanylate cyclase [Myxococcota bacterium]